jgi:hypothetical protein
MTPRLRSLPWATENKASNTSGALRIYSGGPEFEVNDGDWVVTLGGSPLVLTDEMFRDIFTPPVAIDSTGISPGRGRSTAGSDGRATPTPVAPNCFSPEPGCFCVFARLSSGADRVLAPQGRPVHGAHRFGARRCRAGAAEGRRPTAARRRTVGSGRHRAPDDFTLIRPGTSRGRCFGS